MSANLILAKFKLRTSVAASRPGTAGEMGLLLTELASQLEDTLKPTTTGKLAMNGYFCIFLNIVRFPATDFEPSDCVMTMYNLALSRFFAGDILGSQDLVKKVRKKLLMTKLFG